VVCETGKQHLLPKQLLDALHDAVLFWVVRVVLGGDLEERGEGLGVGVDAAADLVGDL
jgi:hypothetical protein